MLFKNVSNVTITILAFHACGSGNVSIGSHNEVDNLGLLEISGRNLLTISALFTPNPFIVNCRWRHKYLPLFLYGSTAAVQSGEFMNNQAGCGGEVLAYNSGIVFTGKSVFYMNSPS